jgi:hypothetical protein
MKQVEEWKEVTKLCSRNSSWEIVNWYYFPKGLYHVSSLGRFKRKDVIVSSKADLFGTKTLSLKGHRFKLHEIVLQVFKPDGNVSGCTPDHINRKDRENNSLSNLRWATRSEQYSNRENKAYKTKLVKCSETGIVYNSCQEAEDELGLTRNTVSRVARGERKSIHGYHFVYANIGLF